jgi:hypothetical protein
MKKQVHNRDVPRTKDNIHIPLTTDEALAALLQVKPTKDMPRPGATKKKTAPKKHVKKKMRS